MSTKKRETKISGAVAESEASFVLEKLRSEPDKAASLGAGLNERFSASPRRSILAEVRKRLPGLKSKLPPDAMLSFLETQFVGVKDQSFDTHLREVLCVAVEMPEDDGLHVAANLMTFVLSSSKLPEVRGIRVPRAAAILTIVFEHLCEAAPPNREHLRAWTDAAHVQLSLATKATLPFNPGEASRLLDALSPLEHTRAPENLLACVPSIIALARIEGAARFLTSDIGQPYAKALSGLTESSSDNRHLTVADEKPHRAPREKLSDALGQIARLFDKTMAHSERLKQRIREQEDEAAQHIAAMKAKVEEGDRRLRVVRAQHSQEIESCNRRICDLDKQNSDLMASIERLRADLSLSDHNAVQNVADQDDEHRRRLGEVLDAAMGSLRRDLERALRNRPEDEHIRNAGISFDSLQRKLMREASHLDQTRIPSELLNPRTS